MGNLDNCFLSIAISAKALELYGTIILLFRIRILLYFSFIVITDNIGHSRSTVRISYDQK